MNHDTIYYQEDHDTIRAFLEYPIKKRNIKYTIKENETSEFLNLVAHCRAYNNNKYQHGSNWIRLDIDQEISDYCKKHNTPLDEIYYDSYIFLIIKGKSHFCACKYAKILYDKYIKNKKKHNFLDLYI